MERQDPAAQRAILGDPRAGLARLEVGQPSAERPHPDTSRGAPVQEDDDLAWEPSLGHEGLEALAVPAGQPFVRAGPERALRVRVQGPHAPLRRPLARAYWSRTRSGLLGIGHPFDDRPMHGYGNFWWGITPSALRAMLRSARFEVVEERRTTAGGARRGARARSSLGRTSTPRARRA